MLGSNAQQQHDLLLARECEQLWGYERLLCHKFIYHHRRCTISTHAFDAIKWCYGNLYKSHVFMESSNRCNKLRASGVDLRRFPLVHCRSDRYHGHFLCNKRSCERNEVFLARKCDQCGRDRFVFEFVFFHNSRCTAVGPHTLVAFK